MFGGLGPSGNLADTWEYDGFNWIIRTPVNAPAARHAHALFWDPVSQKTVLFGGLTGISNNDTWLWDGTNWIQHNQASPVPSERFLPTVGTTPSVLGVLMLGGQFAPPSSTFLQDFWNWDGSGWTKIADSTPVGPRSQGAMTYEPNLGLLILVAGHSTTPSRRFYNDTWGFDGATWRQLSLGTYGTPRATPALAFVPDRGRAVLFGGYADPTALSDTWELHPSGWQQTSLAGAPTPRYGISAIVKPADGRLFLFGGYDGGTFFSDTWVFGESNPPSNSSFGFGCSSGAGVVQLSAARLAWRGERYDMLLSNLPQTPSASPFLLLGTRSPSPIDLASIGAPGCTVLLNPNPSTAIGTNVSGAASFSIVIPQLSPVTTVWWQGAVLAPGANTLGLALSNGLETRVR